MNWLVYITKMKNGDSEVEFNEFEDLGEARRYSDDAARFLRELDYDFDVRIYELTNY